MRLHISEGNSKLGKIPNISLPPVATCRKNVPCAEDCYALKAYKLWPAVTQAWNENLQYIGVNGLGDYFNAIEVWLGQRNPSHFRWHVSGDILSKQYLQGVYTVANTYPDTKFMLFTKRWDLLPVSMVPPSSLSVILSMWPGLPNPKQFPDYPRAWLSNDKRLPKFYFKCPGRCDECYKCWEITKLGHAVVFDKH